MATWEEYKKTMREENSIFESARQGDREALAEYISRGGDIDVRDFRCSSLLMLAAYHDHLDTARLLLMAGADSNTRDHHGNTVLMGVAFKGHSRIIELLLEHGADPLLRNSHGMTALDFAKAFGRRDVVEILSNEKYGIMEQVSSFAKVLTQTLRPWS